MSIRRVAILFVKEAKHGSKSFIFIFAIITPFVLSFILALLFGSLLDSKPRLGLVDQGQSEFVTRAEDNASIEFKVYDSPARLEQAVADGSVDLGIVLPAAFDESVRRGEPVDLEAMVWGESLAKDRLVLGALVTNLTREIAGQEVPLDLVMTTIGEGDVVPWEDRLLPLVVLISVVFGGILLPASSIVNEKEHRTLAAVTLTPTSLEDVYLAKGLMGVIVSVIMALMVLLINDAFGGEPLLLIGILVLGAIMSAIFGILLGTYARDITALFATIKAIGIFLYIPAFVYLFPGIPEWIGRIFPTYYIIAPVVNITQHGAGWSDISLDFIVLAAIDLILLVGVFFVTRKASQHRIVGQI